MINQELVQKMFEEMRNFDPFFYLKFVHSRISEPFGQIIKELMKSYGILFESELF